MMKKKLNAERLVNPRFDISEASELMNAEIIGVVPAITYICH